MSEPLNLIALVPRADHRAVLVTADGTLPSGAVTPESYDSEIAESAATLATAHGIDSPLLRMAVRSDETVPTCLVEFAATGTLPPGTAWRETDPAPLLTAHPTLGERAGQWWREQRTGRLPASRSPWAREGWFTRISAWIADCLRRQGIQVNGAPQPVQQWGISAVLRQPTDSGDYYVKAVFGGPGRGFWQEPAVSQALDAAHPGQVPGIVGIEPDEGWMLMSDMELSGPMSGRPVPEWADGLRILAGIQREWTGRLGELAGYGCPDRGPARLAERLPDMAADPRVTSRLTDAEKTRLADVLPALLRACHRAATGPVPLSLLHGDCHPGNVGTRRDGTVVVYDWSDAAIGHPFWDLRVYLDHAPDAEKPALTQAYLDEWRDVAGPDELDAAVRDGHVLTPVYQVESYLGILENLEPGAEGGFAGAAESWWRKGIEAAARLG